MFLKEHIKYSIIPTLILFFLAGFRAIYFFIGSVFVDIDHYLMYVIENRDFNVRKMFRFYNELFYYAKDNAHLGLNILHTVEFLLIIAVLSFYSNAFFYVLVGIIFHMILDIIFQYKNGLMFKRAFSIIEYMVRKNRLSRVK